MRPRLCAWGNHRLAAVARFAWGCLGCRGAQHWRSVRTATRPFPRSGCRNRHRGPHLQRAGRSDRCRTWPGVRPAALTPGQVMTENDLDQARAALGETVRRTLFDECQANGGCARWRLVKTYGSVEGRLHCPHCLTSYDGSMAIDPPCPSASTRAQSLSSASRLTKTD